MDTHTHVTIINGKHRGQIGTFVSKTDHYTKVRVAGDLIVRCKNDFVQTPAAPAVPVVPAVPAVPVPVAQPDDYMEAIIASLALEEELVAKERVAKERVAKEHTEMIQGQLSEYEEGLKLDLLKNAQAEAKIIADLAHAKAMEFEEVTPDEMRRVRMLRFGC